MMDFVRQLQPILTILVFIASAYILATWTRRNNSSSCSSKPSEAGRIWPIIGHLPLILLGSEPFYHKLHTSAAKHEPVYLLRMGAHPTLVVTRRDAIRECVTTNDKALASRTQSSATGEMLFYNYLMFGGAPNCPYWREMRKMRGEREARKVEMRQWLTELTFQATIKMIGWRRPLTRETEKMRF